jgi:hypothetical protein
MGPVATVAEERGGLAVPSAIGIGSPRRAWQAVESVACMGSHQPASSDAGAGTDMTLIDPGNNASPSMTRRGAAEQLGWAHMRVAKRNPTAAAWSRQCRRGRAAESKVAMTAWHCGPW